MFKFVKACEGFVAVTGDMKYSDLRQMKQRRRRKLHNWEFCTLHKYDWSQDSSISIVIRLLARQLRFDISGVRLLPSPQYPDWLWGTLSLLSSQYQGWSSWSVKMTTHLHLVPRMSMWSCTSTSPCAHILWVPCGVIKGTTWKSHVKVRIASALQHL
jgi:hypothetical protein